MVAYLHPGLRLSFTTCVPRRLPTATLSFDHGSQLQTPATDGAGWGSLLVEFGHRSHEYRKGGLKRHTSEGCFWLRLRSPHNYQGIFLPSTMR